MVELLAGDAIAVDDTLRLQHRKSQNLEHLCNVDLGDKKKNHTQKNRQANYNSLFNHDL